MTEPDATIFVVDDDPSVLKALARLLRSAGWAVQAHASPEEFLDQHDATRPGCLLLDLAMPGFDGLELQRRLSAAGSTRPIVFLTGQADVPQSVRALRAGALNLLTKPVSDDTLLRAVAEAVEKDVAQRRGDAELAPWRKRLGTLTPREREVFGHVIVGRANKRIAADLGIAEKTVKVHRGQVMEKMGVRSVAELVQVAGRLGLGADPQPRVG